MPPSARQTAADAFRSQIDLSNRIHGEYLSDTALLKDYERFTKWLMRYLLAYFRELRAEPGYREALAFVVSELAGVSVSQRDRQLARAAPAVTGLMPGGALQTLATAARLNARTLEINLGICRNMQVDGSLPDELTEEAYFRACREVSSYQEAIELLTLAMDLGKALVPTVQHRLVGLTLKAMNVPAHAAGFGDLQEFFEKGYKTFRDIPDTDRFLLEVEARMTKVFERIYRSELPGN